MTAACVPIIWAASMLSDFNLFLDGASGSSFGDTHSVVDPFPTKFGIESRPKGVTLQFSMNKAYRQVNAPMVDAKLAGTFSTTGQTIEDKNGNPIMVNTDFNGKAFDKPNVGPISGLQEGNNMISWDINH